ncbi:MAG: DUF4347 domain-containing protein [Thermodesulfobacteriota bacterium]
MFHWFRRQPKTYPRIITFERLEERIVLDGNVDAAAQDNNADNQNVTAQNDPAAGPAGAEQAAAAAAAPDSAAANTATAADPLGQIFDQPLNEVLVSNALGEIQGMSPNADAGSTEGEPSQELNVVLISSALENSDALAAAADDDAQVILYDAASANLESINYLLNDLVSSTGMQIDHLAILTHGRSGALSFGSGEFWTVSTIEQDPTQWSVLGSLLDADARIDLYGCSIGAGEEGWLFVDTLASVTGATILASDDLTGNVAGADWVFEVKSADDSAPFLIDVSQLASIPILLGWDGGDGDDEHWYNSDLDAWMDGRGGDDILGNEHIMLDLGFPDDEWGHIWGGDGNDIIYNQGLNADVPHFIDGGSGNDTIYNRDQACVRGSIYGEYGNDTIYNEDEAEVGGDIFGSAGDDTIYNQGEATVGGSIYGHGGNDTIYNYSFGGSSYGVTGNMYGNDGNDQIRNYGVVGGISGGDGDNYLYNGAGARVRGSIMDGGDVGTVYNFGTIHSNISTGGGNDRIYNYGDVLQVVNGGDGDDLIVFEGGGAAAMSADNLWFHAFGIWGGDGSDTIIVKAGSNVRGIDSGSDYSASDTVIVEAGAEIYRDNFNSSDGYYTFRTSNGNDTLDIGGWTDPIGEILTNGGDDTVFFRPGGTFGELYLGTGNDVMHVQGGNITKPIHGEDGTDTLVLSYTVTSFTGTAASGSCVLNGQTIHWDGFESVCLEGGTGNDTFTVTGVDAYTFIDHVYGMEGDDNITVSNSGRFGTIWGDDGAGAPDGNDTITIVAGARVNYVQGEGGNDVINISGTVNNNIIGGDGNDSVHMLTGGWVKGSIQGGEGTDTMYLSPLATNITGNASSGSCQLDGHTVNWSGFEVLTVEATSGNDFDVTVVATTDTTTIDHVYGLSGNDNITVSGSGEFGTVWGDDGNGGTPDGADTIAVVSGATVTNLYGGGGDDTIETSGTVTGDILAGDGNDVIKISGTVNGDTVAGQGDDAVYIMEGAVADRVIHGNAGTDTLGLSYLCTNVVGDASSGQCELDGHTIYWIGFEHLGIVLTDAADTVTLDLSAYGSKIEFVYGLAEGDAITLTGNGNGVSVYGDDGDLATYGGPFRDTIIVQAGAQVDNVYGEEGDDTIRIYGTVHGNVNAGMLGESSNDTIIIDGGIVDGNVLSGDGASDKVYFLGGAVGGTIDAGRNGGYVYLSYLCTDFTGTASSGSCKYDGNTVSWTGFENLSIAFTEGNDTAVVDLGTLPSTLYAIEGLGGDDNLTVRGSNPSLSVYADSGFSPDGNDTVTIQAGAELYSVSAGGGNDTVINYGTVRYLSGRDGDDTISSYGTVTGGVSGHYGNDRYTIEGYVGGDISDFSGDDTIVINGTVMGNVDAGMDSDLVYLLGGSVSGTISGGAGTDTLYLSYLCTNVTGTAASGSCRLNGETVTWSGFEHLGIVGTEGADTATLDPAVYGPYIESVYGLGGSDSLTLSADWSAAPVYGDDNDPATADGGDTIILQAGAQAQSIYGEGGDDTIVLSGTVNGNVDAGAGNDVVRFHGGLVSGTILGGAGEDTLQLTYQCCENITGNANSGSCVFEGNTISWSGFEHIHVVFTEGNDTAVIDLGSVPPEVEGYVLLGGDDNVTFRGVGPSVEVNADGGTSPDGADTITIEAGAQISMVYAGGGNDTIIHRGILGGIDAGDGDDTISIQGTVNGNIDAGAGNNTVTNESYVSGSIIAGAGDDTITNRGNVVGNIEAGNGSDTITNEGVVGSGIFAGGGSDSITNKGSVEGSIDASFGYNTISNDGVVRGGIFAGGHGDTITNKGTVNGSIDVGGGDNTITNEGTVGGSIISLDGQDTISNTGAVDGSIDSGSGNDKIAIEGVVGGDIICGSDWDEVYFKGGEVRGRIDGGDPDEEDTLLLPYMVTNFTADAGSYSCEFEGNTLSWSGFEIVYLDFTEGNDTAYWDFGAIPGGVSAVRGLGGADDLTLAGNCASVIVHGDAGSSTEGADSITIAAGAEFRDVRGNGADDTISNYGTVYRINGQNGDDDISNYGTVGTGGIEGSIGNDIVCNEGTVHGSISGYHGNDSITNKGVVTGSINGGNDNDTISNEGTVNSNISGSYGNDTISNYGTVNGNLSGDWGNDRIVNEGHVQGSMNGDDGDDTIVINGTVDGDVDGWTGNESVYLFGGSVAGTIKGGTGTDTLYLTYKCSNVTGDAASGSCELDGKTFTWTAFEHLGIVLTEGADTVTLDLASYGPHVEFVYGLAGSDNIILTGNGAGIPVYGDDNAPGTADWADNITVQAGAQVGHIYAEGGNDTIIVHGTVTGNIDVGDGDNTVTIHAGAQVNNVLGQGGDDAISVHGTVNGNIDAGGGDDTITIHAGAQANNVSAGVGNDTISVSGVVGQDILAGDGEDTVTIQVGGKVEGIIDGGDPATDPGDSLNIYVQSYSDMTGDASEGSLDDQAGDTIQWSNFEQVSVFTPPPPLAIGGLTHDWFSDDALHRPLVSEPFAGTTGSSQMASIIISFLSEAGLLPFPIELSDIAEELRHELSDFLEEALRGGNSEFQEVAWTKLTDFVHEQQEKTGNPEAWVGLEEFFARLRSSLHGKDLDDVRLAFNADEIHLAEWFDSLINPGDVALLTNGAPEQVLAGRESDWTNSKSFTVDLHELSVAEIFMSNSSGPVAALCGPAREPMRVISQVFDLNKLSFSELVGIDLHRAG